MNVNCKKHSFCNCSDEPIGLKNTNPSNNTSIKILNQIHVNKYSRFQDNTDIQQDPLLFSGAHASYIHLDRTLSNSIPKLDTLYSDPELNGYGKHYNSYLDINAGDIQYYLDSDIRNTVNSNTFYRKQFSDTAAFETKAKKTPMDTYKLETIRIPDNNKEDEYSLSWMKDSQHFRNDISFKQAMTIINKNVR